MNNPLAKALQYIANELPLGSWKSKALTFQEVARAALAQLSEPTVAEPVDLGLIHGEKLELLTNKRLAEIGDESHLLYFEKLSMARELIARRASTPSPVVTPGEVERVARLIYEARPYWKWSDTPKPWDSLEEFVREGFRVTALAALTPVPASKGA